MKKLAVIFFYLLSVVLIWGFLGLLSFEFFKETFDFGELKYAVLFAIFSLLSVFFIFNKWIYNPIKAAKELIIAVTKFRLSQLNNERNKRIVVITYFMFVFFNIYCLIISTAFKGEFFNSPKNVEEIVKIKSELDRWHFDYSTFDTELFVNIFSGESNFFQGVRMYYDLSEFFVYTALPLFLFFTVRYFRFGKLKNG